LSCGWFPQCKRVQAGTWISAVGRIVARAGIAAVERRREYDEHTDHDAPGYLREAPVAAPCACGPLASHDRGYGC